MGKIISIIAGIVIIGALANNVQKNPKQNQSHNVDTNVQNSSQNTSSDNKPSPAEIRKDGISYGSHARNTMNIVIPKGSDENTPFILLIHGGAWTSGDKGEVRPIQARLGERGIASAAMNYRYASNSIHYPELMADISKAISFIDSKEPEWGVDTDKIAIGGVSAGAHMALLYAYDYDSAGKITSVISLAGPTDITDDALITDAQKFRLMGSLEKMVGAQYIQDDELSSKFTDASPISHIKNVPTLLIHGNKDSLVPYTQSTKLDSALAAKGIAHKLMTISGADHDVGLLKPSSSIAIADQITEWVKKYDK